MKRLALLTTCLTLIICQGTPRQESRPDVQRSAPVDSATVMKLCAKPDSVLAGRRDCELRDQSPPQPGKLP